ncbi:MAG: integrase core domain-containing protein [Candidatus Enteromonas sp.]
MAMIPQEGRNYRPTGLETRYHACLRMRESEWPLWKVIRFYHVKKASLYRWLKRFDGAMESLLDRSHRPKSDHPRKTKAEVAERIKRLRRRNPDASFVEISPSTVLRILKSADFKPYVPAKKAHDKPYHAPDRTHVKWQVDVKYVAKSCTAPRLEGRFYQYTILEECTRKRVLYFTNEQSMYETVSALKIARKKFGHWPEEIQTDNGFEFTDSACRKKERDEGNPNYLDSFLRGVGVRHHLIRPRTPQHNGKAERSHRIDQDRFYRKLEFRSLEDLRKQGEAWCKRYNAMPKKVLGCKTPNEMEIEKLRELKDDIPR